MMIKSNPLQQRKARPGVPTAFKERKLTLEEHTLNQIANLKENKSIIIDCNALQGEG